MMMTKTFCWLIAGIAFACTIPLEAAETPPVKLERATLFIVRDRLPNVAAKLKEGKEINVVFLGGSITVGGASPKGYVTFVTNWLKENYPNAKANVINSGISGTGSDFGARRYDRDVLAKNPDLVLIEFCVNDGTSDQTAAMERMVHKTWMKNPQTDIVIFYTLAQTHLEYYKVGSLPPSASAHERVAAFYGIPTLGTGFYAASKVNTGEIPWSGFSGDGCHPNQNGYILFADVFAKALPQLLKASTPQAHTLGKSITSNLVVYPPPVVVKPLEYKGDFITAKGEKAQKVYPLPIPNTHWIKEPVYRNAEGKTLWRLSWMPSALGRKADATVGADKTKWENNDMVWFEGDGCFTGPNGQGLFRPHASNAILGSVRSDMGLLRFIAPETGRYALMVTSGPWGAWQSDDKEMSMNILKFTWKGGTGESLALQKEIKKESKGLNMAVETTLAAGEELVFVPDCTGNMGGTWTKLMIVVGWMGK
jgi:lysophospholipase L1-like esterase